MLQTLSESMFITIIDRVDHVCIFMKELQIFSQKVSSNYRANKT